MPPRAGSVSAWSPLRVALQTPVTDARGPQASLSAGPRSPKPSVCLCGLPVTKSLSGLHGNLKSGFSS